MKNRGGYTLLEALIALFILVAVIVPLMMVFYKNTDATETRKSFTAMCLLEQESARVRTFPEAMLPIKRRLIEGREWIIRTECAGKDLVKYTMTASDGSRERGAVIFFGRGADAKIR